MMKKNGNHGGARKGAGRKKKEPTRVLSWRVPKTIAPGLKEKIDPVVEKAVKKHRENKKPKK